MLRRTAAFLIRQAGLVYKTEVKGNPILYFNAIPQNLKPYALRFFTAASAVHTALLLLRSFHCWMQASLHIYSGPR